MCAGFHTAQEAGLKPLRATVAAFLAIMVYVFFAMLAIIFSAKVSAVQFPAFFFVPVGHVRGVSALLAL
jgi:hypothetical protein